MNEHGKHLIMSNRLPCKLTWPLLSQKSLIWLPHTSSLYTGVKWHNHQNKHWWKASGSLFWEKCCSSCFKFKLVFSSFAYFHEASPVPAVVDWYLFTDEMSLMLSVMDIVMSYWCRSLCKFSWKEKETITVIHIDEEIVMWICTGFVSPILVPC